MNEDMGNQLKKRLIERGFTARDYAIVESRCHDEPQSLNDIKVLLDSYGYDYSWNNEYIVQSATVSLRSETLSCINAAVMSYALLDVLGNKSRILLAIHRRDQDGVECGHVVALGETQGCWFALGKSNYPELNAVYGPFESRNAVALAFARAYVSIGFTPLYYGFFHPEACCAADELIASDSKLNSLCEYMVSNYQYAYSVSDVRTLG